MKDILEAGTWTCSFFHKEMSGERAPVILCKDQLDDKKSYFFLYKDKIIIHKPEKMSLLKSAVNDKESVWILKRKNE